MNEIIKAGTDPRTQQPPIGAGASPEQQRLPVWRNALDAMKPNLCYGQAWAVEFFESIFRSERGTRDFQFEMLALRAALEEDEGYYLKSSEDGKVWSIPTESGHEDTATIFDRKVRRYAVRSINLRSATLTNPKAQIADEDRRRMESNLEKASVRLMLLTRQRNIEAELRKSNPALLQNGK